jgi:hypothetical protein
MQRFSRVWHAAAVELRGQGLPIREIAARLGIHRETVRQHLLRNGLGNKPRSLEERFWSKVEKSDGCWLWRGAIGKRGYGTFSIGGRTYRAHRIAYEMTYRPLSPGVEACHHCDTPLCVRPDHLFAGTHAENVADMVEKARHRYGEVHPKARLTAGEVIEIRALYATGSISQARLGARYAVSKQSIAAIIHGKHWTRLARLTGEPIKEEGTPT